MTGRPSLRTDAMVDAILKDLSEGTPLAEICRRGEMPGRSTFLTWVKEAGEGDDLPERYARAREDGHEAIAADTLRIADFAENDTYTDSEGNERTNNEVIARSKLRIDTRFRLLRAWAPKIYGDKVALGGDTESPLTVVVRKLSDA